MFGFSKEEVLAKAIKNACSNKLNTYEHEIQQILRRYQMRPKMSESELSHLTLQARRNYLNAVCDSIWSSFSVSNPNTHARFKLALMSPQMTGLPEEINVDYLNTNGISAGVVFALAFFALTNKQINSPKLFRTMSILSHYQNDLMESVLTKFDKA